MTNETTHKMLFLPALRAHMGDWLYYISFMKMHDIAARVNTAEEIHSSNSLKELIQREVDESKHSAQIKTYLLTQQQRLFNALVIGIYGGAPKWYELDIEGNNFLDEEDLPTYLEGTLGMLVLEGSEKLFALDGQHRVVGIRKALEENEDLGDEEVSAIFVAHRNDPEGLERTRRLFTKLNRYAKPVKISEIIALDEDDIVAIITRRLVEQHPLFKNKVSLAKTRSISRNDTENFTAIVALYDALDTYLPTTRRGWNDFKKQRPDDEEIDRYYEESIRLWEVMIKKFPPLQELQESTPSDKVASKYRHREGGHLLFRPIGFKIIINAIKYLIETDNPLPRIVNRISQVNLELVNEPWVGLLWDNTNNRMITASENQRVAQRLLIYSVGGNLARAKTTPQELRREYAGLLNKEVEDVKLPKYFKEL